MTELRRRRKAPTPKVRYVSVEFGESRRSYTYKTIHDLEVGDKVIVQAGDRLSSATIVNPDVSTPKFKCKWVIGKINYAQYERDFKHLLEDLGLTLDSE